MGLLLLLLLQIRALAIPANRAARANPMAKEDTSATAHADGKDETAPVSWC